MTHHWDPKCPLEIRVDASENSLGCEIVQHREDGSTELVALNSRKLKQHERNYTVPKKELLSAIYFLKKYEHMFRGRHFTLRIDNQAIATLASLANQDNCRDKALHGWMSLLHEFSFDVKHIRGVDNVGADAMSRNQMVTVVSDPTASGLQKEEDISAKLKKVHGQGHFGTKALVDYARQHAHLNHPDIWRICKGIASNCGICQQINAGKVGFAPQRFKNVTDIMDNVYADILELRETPSGMKYIIFAVDYLSKYVWLKALGTNSAAEMAEN